MQVRCAPLIVTLLALCACSTYRDQLARSQQAFDQPDYDRALALLRDLEPDLKRLSAPEQAEYCYLRGLSDYRIGYRSDARHWLALAKAYEDNSPGVLPADWKARVNEALDQLNTIVYNEGIAALTTARRPEADEEHKQEKPEKKDPARGPKKEEAAPREEPAPAKEEPPKKEEAPKGEGVK